MLSFLKVSKHYNIDPEEVWNLIIDLGSFDKVAKNLFSRGIINQKNGKPFTNAILQRVAWRWIIENPDRAYEIIHAKVPDMGTEYWEQFLVSKAFTVFVTIRHNRKQFETWLVDRGLDIKYVEYRKSKYFRN